MCLGREILRKSNRWACCSHAVQVNGIVWLTMNDLEAFMVRDSRSLRT